MDNRILDICQKSKRAWMSAARAKGAAILKSPLAERRLFKAVFEAMGDSDAAWTPEERAALEKAFDELYDAYGADLNSAPRANVIHVRVTDDELADLRAFARQHGMYDAAYIRWRLFDV